MIPESDAFALREWIGIKSAAIPGFEKLAFDHMAAIAASEIRQMTKEIQPVYTLLKVFQVQTVQEASKLANDYIQLLKAIKSQLGVTKSVDIHDALERELAALQSVREQNARYQSLQVNTEKEQSSVSDLKSIIETLEAENSHLRSRFKELTDSTAIVSEDKATIQSTLDALHETKTRDAHTIRSLQSDLYTLRDKHHTLELESSTMKSNFDTQWNIERDKLSRQISSLTAELSAVQAKIPKPSDTFIFGNTSLVTDQLETSPTPQYREHYKRAPIPFFSGTEKENVSNWIFLLECHFKADNVTDLGKVHMAIGYLRDLPLMLYRRMATENSDKVTWVMLKKQLLDEFQPIDFLQTLRDELICLRQQGNNYHDYLRKFNLLVTQSDFMSERDKITYFKRGLPGRTAEEVTQQRPDTLAKAITIATAFQQKFQHRRVLDTFDVEEIQRQKSLQKYGYTNYVTNNNGQTRYSKTSSDSKPIQCYKCNKPGHFANNCNNSTQNSKNYNDKRNQENQFKQSTSKPPSTNHQTFKHKSMLITKSSNDKLYDLIRVTTLLNGHHSSLVLDSAANASVISTKFAHQLKLPYKRVPTTIQIAESGPSREASQTADTVRVEVYGSVCHIKLLVHDLPHNIQGLLGLDWFHATRCVVDTIDRSLQFKAREVSLSDHPEQSSDVIECYMTEASGTEEDGIDEDQSWDDHIADELDVFNVSQFSEQHPALQEHEVSAFMSMLGGFRDLFATSYHELGHCKSGKHTIRINNSLVNKPIFTPPYRKSFYEREAIKQEVQRMLDARIIRASRSPWSSPVVMVTKKDGSMRFCVDYRKLNAVTDQDHFPLPRIDDILDRLSGSAWFTTLDLKSGYWQIEMSPESIETTAFSTPDGHYEFLRLPFGLKNAPADFSRIMHQIFGDLPYIQIYLDDFTIHSATFDDHLIHVAEVLTRLQDINLKINGDKCVWLQDTISLLGHVVSGHQVKMDTNKISAVQNMKPPQTIKQVQQFLGLCGYYRKFILHFANIAHPLYNLLKKDTVWSWNDNCQDAFVELKRRLMDNPILRQPVFSIPFIVYTDASNIALGAILAQVDPITNQEYVCAYASRLLQGAEIHYGITEKECLGVLWAVKHFRVYVYGQKFTVVTDHSALAWLMSIKEPTGRLARWSLYLQTYTFDVVYRKGKIHSNVDPLSRPVFMINAMQTRSTTLAIQKTDVTPPISSLISSTDTDIEYDEPLDISSKTIDPYDNDSLIYYLEYGKHRAGSSKNSCKRVEKLAHAYYFADGNLYYSNNSQSHLRVPRKEERFKLAQNAHLLGHFQTQSTIARLQQQYFWPRMTIDVEKVIRQCLPCKRHHHTPAKFHPALALPITGIFDRVGMDLIFGLTTTPQGYKGLLVITEYLSKFPFVMPIRSKTATEIAEKLFTYISIFGPPKELLSDQGTEFLNQVVDTLSTLTGIERRVTSPYHPRTNGLTERFNQTLVNALRKHTDADPISWPSWIPYIVLAYRTRVHSTTNYTPYEMVFGRKMNHFDDWNHNQSETTELELLKRAREIRTLIEDTQPDTVKFIKQKQELQKRAQDFRDKPIITELERGTAVYVRVMKIQDKLKPRFIGPYTVEARTDTGDYILSNQTGKIMKQQYPLSRLKLVEPESASTDHASQMLKILDFRERYGKFEYFVEWENYGPEMNSWVKESQFEDTELIEDFWATHSKPPDNMVLLTCTTHPLRHRIHHNHFNYLFALVKILISMMILNGTPMMHTLPIVQQYSQTNLNNYTIPSTTIHGSFLFCDVHDRRLLSQYPTCEVPKPKEGKQVLSEWHLLSKRHHAIDGFALTCEVLKIITTATYTFWGDQYANRREMVVLMSASACQDMWNRKSCGWGTQLLCLNDECVYHKEPEVSYVWPRSKDYDGITCKVTRKRLILDSKDTTVALGANGPCVFDDLYCPLARGVMLWTIDAWKPCEYEFILSGNFTRMRDSVFAPMSSTNSTTRDRKRHLYLQLLSPITVCNGTVIYPTTEGLYATQDALTTTWDKVVQTMDVLEHLFLADADFVTNMLQRQTMKNDLVGLETTCRLIMNSLRHDSEVNDTLATINDVHGKPLIIYYLHSTIYVPKCYNVSEYRILAHTENCYKDVPITIVLNQTTPLFGKQEYNVKEIPGFLTTSGLLKLYSSIIDCSNRRLEINVQDTYLVSVTGSHTRVTTLDALAVFRWKPLATRLATIDFNHNELLTDNFELYAERLGTISSPTILETDHHFKIEEDTRLSEQNQIIKFGQIYESLSDFGHKSVTYMILTILGCLVLLILALYFYNWVRQRLMIRRLRTVHLSDHGLPPTAEGIPLNTIINSPTF